MPTLQELRDEHNGIVAGIREDYHDTGTITHDEYHTQLNAEAVRFEQALIDNGYKEPEHVDVGTLFPEKARLVADGADTCLVYVVAEANATFDLDVFFSWDEGAAVAASVETNESGRGTLTIGPFEAGTTGTVVVAETVRGWPPYERCEVEVVDA